MVGYGLYGQQISGLALEADGSVVAALARGMLRRTKYWDQWQTLYQGLTYPDVASVAVDPQTRTLYAGTAPAAVFDSTDGGQQWKAVGTTHQLSYTNGWTNPEPPHCPKLFRLIAHPGRENCLIGGIQAGGVIVSLDGGRSWRNQKAGLSRQLTDLRLHRERPDRLYACNFLGFYRSDDLGGTWEKFNHGLPYIEAQALCVHTVDPDRLLLAVKHPTEESSVIFRSSNGGQKWELACSELPAGEGLHITCLEAGGGVFFAGTEQGYLFGSRDGGSWELVRAELPPIRNILWVGEAPQKKPSAAV